MNARDVWIARLEEGGYEYHVVAGYPESGEADHIDTLPTRREAEECANTARLDFGPEVTVGVYKHRRKGA
jgi:hypothetical protein